MACDKLAAKEYALSICPEVKTAQVRWVGDDPDQLPQDALSGDVLVKANHGSRWNMMIRNGACDLSEVRAKARLWVGRRYGSAFGEWGYRGARRRVFVEEMLLENGEPIRTEYKFHVLGGRTAYVYVSRRNDDGSESKCYITRNGAVAPVGSSAADAVRPWAEIKPPSGFSRMVGIAERLAAAFDYMRCDLYELKGEIFFSELTAYPLAGRGGSSLRLQQLRNSAWDLKKSWFLTQPQRGWRGLYASALRRWLNQEGFTPHIHEEP